MGRWIAIGCAGLVALGCLGGLIAGGMTLTALRNSDAFRTSGDWVQAQPAVQARVGEAAALSWFPQGSIAAGEGTTTAEFTHHVTGPKGTTTVRTHLELQDGHWVVTRASFADSGRPEAIPVDEPTVPGETPANPGGVAAAVAEAQAAYAAGRDTDAVAAADRALDLDAHDADAHYWRARAEARQGDNERAIVDFQAAVEARGAFAEAWEGLAWAQARAGHDPEAVRALDALLGLRPTDGKAYADRANARYRLGDRAAARADAVRSCENNYVPGCDLEARLAKMGG